MRKVLRGLVPSRRQHSHLATWKRENLLFICTHEYQHFRFAYFKAPPENTRAAPLAAFGWGPDMPARTACEFNLPALVWPDAGTTEADWVNGWATAFDVEKVTKKFYGEYATVFSAVEKSIATENGLKDGEDLRMFTQTLVNRLMFLRFLERKGWLKFNGKDNYLRALYDAGAVARKSFYRGRLLPLFFEGLSIILLMHAQVATFKNPEGPDYDRFTPAVDKTTWNELHCWADLIIFGHRTAPTVNTATKRQTKGKLTSTDQPRVLMTERRPSFDAKNRHGLNPIIECGDSPQLAWLNLRDAMRNARPIPTTTETTKSTPAPAPDQEPDNLLADEPQTQGEPQCTLTSAPA